MTRRNGRPKRGPASDKANPLADEPVGRGLGLDSRDIPGGQAGGHLVNAPTIPGRPAAPPAADLFAPGQLMDHGVPDDLTEPGYRTPPKGTGRAPRPAPEPDYLDAVPVYEVQGPGHKRTIRTTVSDGPYTIGATDTAIRRVCDRDARRSHLYLAILGTGIAYVGQRAELDQGYGFEVIHGNIQKIETQDELYLANLSGTSITWSSILVTEVEETI